MEFDTEPMTNKHFQLTEVAVTAPFGSAKNTTASGNPVPICIGERRWGGAIISVSIRSEDLA
ncbi:Bacteriophage lambda tail assembly protein I [compost metagenome]